MSGNFLSLILDAVIIGYGIYAAWLYTDMKRTGKLRQNLMLPRRLEAARCKDVPGYVKFMGPRILLFGVAAVICGLILLSQDLSSDYNLILGLGALLVFLGFCFWYARESKKSVRKFW